jgi:hypothetical protein
MTNGKGADFGSMAAPGVGVRGLPRPKFLRIGSKMIVNAFNAEGRIGIIDRSISNAELLRFLARVYSPKSGGSEIIGRSPQ